MEDSSQSTAPTFNAQANQQQALNAHLVEIETPRLKIREFTLADVDAVFNIIQQPNFAFHYFDGTRKSVVDFVNKCIDKQNPDPATGQRSDIMMAVERKDDGAFVGFASVETVHYPEGTTVMEPNFFIDPSIQNKGYGREAVINVMKYVFDNLKIAGLNATIESHNKPSLAVALSEGYKDTGREISFNTPQGVRTYMVLSLDRTTFYEKRQNDKVQLILQKGGANDNSPKP